MKAMTNGNRIKWIDYSRVMAICLVVYGHILIRSSSFNSHIDNIIMVLIYSFHMPMFFVISGFVFKGTSIIECIVSRLKRLMIPYFFFCLLAFFIYAFLYKFIDTNMQAMYLSFFTGKNLIDTLLMKSSSVFSDYWFLPVLFWTSILLNLVLLFDNHLYESLLIVMMALISISLKRYNIELPFGMGESFLALPFMYIGYMEKKSGYETLDKYWLLLASVIVYLVAIIYYKKMDYGIIDMRKSNIHNPVLFYALGICGSYISFFVIKRLLAYLKRSWYIIEWFGISSLFVYGIHYFFLDLSFRIFEGLGGIEAKELMGLFRIIAFGGTLLGCYVVFELFSLLCTTFKKLNRTMI
ncbi:acyltransferase family protein [Butyrivibrio fibrisolvens]|uniref:acyltransferase family protein n=1 Tax=Butyrivibrio fibrisolvens TaxID=831 RepID=UPI0003FF1FDA|nr:acyltransferase family protein [Butyrivibrio fibrisolvens]